MDKGKYHLECLECGKTVLDEYTNTCPDGHDSLLRTEYKAKRIRKLAGRGMFNYIEWLPVEEALPLNSGPITYKTRSWEKNWA
jgi:hypothetical protein